MPEISRNELWLPGREHSLGKEYPTPSPKELTDSWSDYLDGRPVVTAPNIFGAVQLPEQPPTGYASIDLCEVVRQTAESVYAVEKPNDRPDCIHCYAGGLAIQGDAEAVTQTLMNSGQIPPDSDIAPIADIMRSWRNDGIYVFANTSTLPGCEISTIKFLKEYLKGTFDGILLPRNHDGLSPTNKGTAARNLVQLLRKDPSVEQTIIMIDDKTHHHVDFRRAMADLPNLNFASYQPLYPSCEQVDVSSIKTATPLEAFAEADQFLHID